MSFQNRYGVFDRLLHRIAFATPGAQRGSADLEARMFRAELEAFEPGPPVLVTALPRAGTTMLLELLAATPEFAAHSYRDMPFVLCPMVWSRLSRPFQRDYAPRERAHGDGIEVGPDSPEAFEEMLWKAFFKPHYRGATLPVWRSCDESDFVDFYAQHRRKVIALRRRVTPSRCRYVSKNNANIARLPAIWRAVPDAIVVVPFREPVQHAASLLRQHQKFCRMHDEDAFVRRYMAGIGHHDFGRDLKPIDFGGWFAGRTIEQADKLEFWLEYWRRAYRHVLTQTGQRQLHLVRFKSLDGRCELTPLADLVQMEDPTALTSQAARLRPVADRDVDLEGVPAALVDDCRALYDELNEAARI